MKKYFTFLLCVISICLNAQKPVIRIIDSLHKTNIRGLSVVDDRIIWCSGSNGQVARSINGGKSFEWQTVVGYEKRDFRDIEAFDSNSAIIMGIAEPAIILKTSDGGITWKKVFEDSTKGMFLDAMDFVDNRRGVVIGDPVGGKFYIASTIDGGNNWKPINSNAKPDSGEAFFAASGGNIVIGKDRKGDKLDLMYVSGVMKAKFYCRRFREGLLLPICQGKESAGANAIAKNGNNIIIVGGDFSKDSACNNNCVLFNLLGDASFMKPKINPHGYRSSVAFITKKMLITCGTSGVDISYDGGIEWQLLSKESFNVVRKAKRGGGVYLAGARGRIAKLAY